MPDITKTKIIMLGGRRSGKSTILSTVLFSLKEKASHLCAFNDVTPYGSSSGMQIPLKDKRLEIDEYLRKRNKFGNNSQFIVDMSPSMDQGDFNLVASIEGASQIGFDFVDVPGEWMEENHAKHSELVKQVKESDVFVIAIDTPYLMQDENPNINTVWNRTEEIDNLLANIITEDKADKKLILFVPVKCEKWVNSGEIDRVTEKVKQAYRVTINKWVNNPAVEMWVMPIQTAGGLEHTRLLDAYRFYRDKNDKVGEICSIDPLTDILQLRDGKTLFRYAVDSVEEDPDKSYCLSYTQLPLSWYKSTGTGFKPKNCEQIAFRILHFLVKKEELMSTLKYEEYKSKIWWIRIFLSGGRFGRYLPKYRELINNIPIKTTGDGFQRIESMVVCPDED